MQYVNVNEDLHEYEVGLSLYNVDHSAVGYYGCFDSTIDSQQVLKEIDKEPNDTNHISYIYIYVNGEAQIYYECYVTVLYYFMTPLFSYHLLYNF